MVISADMTSVYCTCFPKHVHTEDFGQLASCKGCHLSIPDEESIYTAFKDVKQIRYMGTKALSAKRYLINTTVERQRFRGDVDKLIRKYGTESLSSTIQSLLRSGVFTSYVAARERFPGLDHDMPAADCDDDVRPSEENGEYDEIAEKATEEEATAQKVDWGPAEPTTKDSYDDWPGEPEAVKEDDPIARDPEPELICDTPVPDAEEETMSGKPEEREALTETTPEEPDCEFVAPTEPSAKEAPVVEDKTWPEKITSATGVDPTNAYEEPTIEAKPVDVGIQDTVVNRTPIDSTRMKRFLDDAVKLTEMLNIKDYSDMVKKVRLDIGMVIEGLSREEQDAEDQKEKKPKRIAEERMKLDEQEAGQLNYRTRRGFYHC
ncbi:hypothetical protein ACKAV7_012003 [Fusarium commune]